MSWSLRRAALVSLLVTSVLAASALGQLGRRAGPAGKVESKKDDKESKDDFGESSAISLPRDNKLKAQIEAAGDYIKTEDWVLATEILQKLVGIKEDVFAKLPRKTPDGKDAEIWTSVRAEANRLIASLPPRGLAFYQLTYGPKAAELLKEAKATNKPELLALIMRLYLHTDAGAEATELLGTYHLDRGNFSTASRCFSLLLGRPGADKLPPVTLFKAAYAFHQTGAAEDKRAEEDTWKLLSGRVRDVKFGDGEARGVDELQSFVSASVRPGGEVYANDYPLYRGNASRSAQGVGSHAFMESRWRQSCLRGSQSSETARWLKAAEEYLRRNNQPILSSFFPVTATVLRKSQATGRMEKTPLLLYRSNWGIHAVHMKTGKLDWETPSKWSLDGMTSSSGGGGKQQAIQNWMTFYLQLGQQFGGARPAIVFENSTIGTLSTDANFVYAVEDLQVPPPAVPYGPEFGGRFPGQAPNYSSPDVSDAVQHSRLQAFEIATGKLKWELGDTAVRDELSDCYFLGPPLPLGGKLYVLTERQQELRLACIDPATPPKVVSMQTLATTREKMQADVTRRTEAAHLSYSEGILVCPTNAGAVLGVDLLSNSLVWAYPYREKAEAEEWRPGMGRAGMPVMTPDGRTFTTAPAQQWKVSAPVIVDGKVVFTAPDSRALHCVNLRDGAPLWKATRSEDDQYLAGVFAGRVVIVGRKSVRALSLDKGEPLWTVDTGMPSGQGVASENVYYLPLQAAGQSKEPEICAIDVEKGVVVAHTKSRKKEVPGNLLFYEGDVISQTATDVVAFPQLKVKLAEIDELITKNPDDPAGLTERGVLRLDEGNLPGAIEDLDKALKNHPDPKTEERGRAKLFETLTEYFQRDFDRAERYLSRYEELCKVTPAEGATDTEKAADQAEEHRRRANFLCLVAKGREKQGRLVEAFELYQQFSAVEGTQELISVVDEPAVRAAPDVWTQGRLAAMAANATPENRKPLEEKLARRWQEVKAANDPEELRKFVAVFGSLFAVGKEARLALAERLIDNTDSKALLEGERHLSLLRGPGESPAVAARAVECLARLCTRKGLLEDAAFYYHILGTRYASEVVRDGRTGADLFAELATDKRFLPLLDDPGRRALLGRVNKGVEERGSYHYNQQIYGFEQRGEPLPFFRSHLLALQYGGQMHQLRLIDRATGDIQWSPSLTLTHFGNVVSGNGQPNMARYGYQTLGHLAVLPIGDMVFGIDPVHKQVLWERSVYGRQSGGPPSHTQLLVDPHDNNVDVVYPDGWKQRLGQTGPLGGNTVCLQTRDALVALDPVTGRTVWTRSDVVSQSHIFGDEDTLYVVEMGHDEPSSTKAMRASDGVSVKVPDFTAVYRKRLRVLGSTLLVSESDAKGAPTLRLYDIKTGKDLWKEKFAVNARVLQSEEPTLTGVVEADGRVRVFDLKARKEVLNAKLSDPHHLDKVTSVHLLADDRYFYLACSEPLDPAVMPFGGPQPLLMPGTGMRALPVNGAVYCFKADGKVNWYTIVRHQMLVLDQFAELPVVLFASRYQRWGAAGAVRGNVVQVATASAFEKQSGKLKYTNDNVPNSMYFHSLTINPRAGKVEFIGYQLKISFSLDNSATTAGTPKVDPAGGGASRGAAGDGRADGGKLVEPPLETERIRMLPPAPAAAK
jgi:outer membrane protein assembly factor BamB/tetratricopeptide (TPR) repeat protein